MEERTVAFFFWERHAIPSVHAHRSMEPENGDDRGDFSWKVAHLLTTFDVRGSPAACQRISPLKK